ncbi:S-adenosylmethionine:tRNA ribosyltransferase-isomerase [Nitrospira sp.]|nr:S-adenosylmethionine:tRNA ribosyltransferase-isomerase [Nitrospira sp.]
MRLSDFDFPFDPSLVALHPFEPRDQARLLILRRDTGKIRHGRIADLPALLGRGDLLVANDTKVLPARLMARRVDTGKQVEVLLVRPLDDTAWEIMAKGRFRVGQRLEFAPDAIATILRRDQTGTVIRIDSMRTFREIMDERGRMPLPPYIKRAPMPEDRHWYQTTFAREDGAIAAPTAGLHLTERLRTRLSEHGIEWATITLHVGPGTFKPVTTSRIEEHRMEAERCILSEATALVVNRARERHGRVVAIGTTAVRTLESSIREDGRIGAYSGETALFITPGYRFRVINALLTNFHLPKSTLLMLVSAFAGVERVREAYRVAVQERYRFYSYGDAMLIL